MGFNGINGQAVQKASSIINEIIDNGKLKKYKVTLSEFYEFYEGVQILYKNGMVETISEAVKNLYKKCGFKAEPDGIGYKINGII